jgi:polynucleotide 5'-hydroxyl-kinase GRC3/NOL9
VNAGKGVTEGNGRKDYCLGPLSSAEVMSAHSASKPHMEIVPEACWETLRVELMRKRGVAMILGMTDSGKSTLAKYLLKELLSENIRVSLVDSDVGQSSLGLPGTISMKVFSSEGEEENFRFERMFFVGTVNPAKRFPLIIEGTRKLTDLCKTTSDLTLIDTSGLVAGEMGKALKARKIKTVKPDHLIALQREDELEHILCAVEDIPIDRVKVSPMVRARSRGERLRYRREKFLDYFDETGLEEFLLEARGVRFFDGIRPISPETGMFKPGTIIGLNHEEDTVAVGIIGEIAANYITFRSPIGGLKKINKVMFGDMTLR